MFEKIILIIIGAFIGAAISHFYEKKSKLFEQQQAKKEERYLCIILLLEAFINFDASFIKFKKHRPDITSKEELFKEIQTEHYNMLLFASENVLFKTNEFIKTPSIQTFIQVSLAMRKDLWGLKTSRKLNSSFKTIYS